jgi:hypothetical protein
MVSGVVSIAVANASGVLPVEPSWQLAFVAE